MAPSTRTTRKPRKVGSNQDNNSLSKCGSTAIQRPRVAKPAPRKQPPTMNWEVRRILGERPISRSDSEGKVPPKEYLIQWYPSWIKGGNLRKPRAVVLAEWENFKQLRGDKRKTIKIGNTLMLRDNVETENDHPDQQRLMLEEIIEKVKEVLGMSEGRRKMTEDQLKTEDKRLENLWFELVRPGDWAFSNEKEEKKAKRISAAQDPSRKIRLASDVLRCTYKEMEQLRRQKKHEANKRAEEHIAKNAADYSDTDSNEETERPPLIYGSVKLRYLGQLDPHIKTDGEIEDRPAHPIYQIIGPLFSTLWEEVDAENLASAEVAFAYTQRWKWCVQQMIDYAPFMLKHTWILFFTRLLYNTDLLNEQLRADDGPHINLGKGWAHRSRDVMVHTYYREVEDEHRAPHEIQETYLNLRDYFHDMQPGGPERNESSDEEEEHEEDLQEGNKEMEEVEQEG